MAKSGTIIFQNPQVPHESWQLLGGIPHLTQSDETLKKNVMTMWSFFAASLRWCYFLKLVRSSSRRDGQTLESDSCYWTLDHVPIKILVD